MMAAARLFFARTPEGDALPYRDYPPPPAGRQWSRQVKNPSGYRGAAAEALVAPGGRRHYRA